MILLHVIPFPCLSYVLLKFPWTLSSKFYCRLTISALISIIARFLSCQISATNKLISVEQRQEGGKLHHGRETKFKTSPFSKPRTETRTRWEDWGNWTLMFLSECRVNVTFVVCLVFLCRVVCRYEPLRTS